MQLEYVLEHFVAVEAFVKVALLSSGLRPFFGRPGSWRHSVQHVAGLLNGSKAFDVREFAKGSTMVVPDTIEVVRLRSYGIVVRVKHDEAQVLVASRVKVTSYFGPILRVATYRWLRSPCPETTRDVTPV
jgi:hypothetical protein